MPPGGRGQLLCAIAPIIETAEKAHKHEARMRCDRFDIKIDRIRMAQRRERREAHIGLFTIFQRCRREPKIAIGKRQKDDGTRRLAKIDGAFRFVDRPRRRAQKMNGRSADRCGNGRAIKPRLTDHH
jgi:hypothetical protein